MKNRYVSHPGKILKEAIDELGLTVEEFAEKAKISIKKLLPIVNEEKPISAVVACKLGAYFGDSYEGWLNLQYKYDSYKRREKENDPGK